MRKFTALSIALVVALGTSLGAATAVSAAEPSPELEALSKFIDERVAKARAEGATSRDGEVAVLQKEVADLKKRISELETTPDPSPSPDPEPSEEPEPEPTKPPEPVGGFPKDANQVTIDGQARTVAGYDRARGENELVVYTKGTTGTNRYGVEVKVGPDSKVTSVHNRLATETGPTAVPAGGYVLSGHQPGTGWQTGAAQWLLDRAQVGDVVTLSKAAAPPPPPVVPSETATPAPDQGTTSSAPMGYPSKVQAVYHMMWSNSGSPQLRDTRPEVNVVNLAFLQGNGVVKLPGWGSQSEASFVADAKALRAKGVRIVASIGGGGATINVSNRQGVIDGVMALNAKIPLDGIDWDVEGSAFPQADVVAISKELKRLRGDKFAITMAPNGSNIDAYQKVANELHRQGVLDFIGQQFYDAVVSKEAALGRVRQLVSGGLPQEKVGVGMMVGPQNTYWTVDECIEAVRFIEATYPNLRGGYLWEAGRAGTADWAARMAPLLKG